MLDDNLETQVIVRDVFEQIKGEGQGILDNFLDLLIEKDFQTIHVLHTFYNL